MNTIIFASSIESKPVKSYNLDAICTKEHSMKIDINQKTRLVCEKCGYHFTVNPCRE